MKKWVRVENRNISCRVLDGNGEEEYHDSLNDSGNNSLENIKIVPEGLKEGDLSPSTYRFFCDLWTLSRSRPRCKLLETGQLDPSGYRWARTCVVQSRGRAENLETTLCCLSQSGRCGGCWILDSLAQCHEHWVYFSCSGGPRDCWKLDSPT